MTWTYSEDPAASNKDAVRFYLQDVVEDEPFLSDEEIQHLIDTYLDRWSSTIAVAALCAEILSNRFAREMNVSGDGVSIDTAALQQRFAEVASSLRELYKQEAHTETFLDDFSGVLAYGFDDSLAPLNFGLGMHDNYEAGTQFEGRPQRYYDELEAYTP